MKWPFVSRRKYDALQKELEGNRRHFAAQNLGVIDAAFKAEWRLVEAARKWSADPASWDNENENRAFRQIRYAVERMNGQSTSGGEK